MAVLKDRFPQWRDLIIHESSPARRAASSVISESCARYLLTQFFPNVPRGSIHDGVRCENLELLTFEYNSIDLHVTQDVMEHVFDPAASFREIARTLRLGGAHIFTVPLVNKNSPSFIRARLADDGQIEHFADPSYHGNPISDEGALVITDWGFDICRLIFDACGLFTELIYIDDLQRGIRAEYIEVLVTRKPLD